ncbi:MAG: AAA family ATPase [Solirubrobacterales bacterium]
MLSGISRREAQNPFRYGALALDEAFANRERELAELVADVRNGQDVVIFAPRRYGKSSLVWRAVSELGARRVLVAEVDLMTTPTKQKLAEKLATSIYENVASVIERARERALAPFRALRVQPTITVDTDGTLSFSFELGRRRADIDATLERLLELPAELGAGRRRQVALVLDEFQEVVEIDPELPKLMRSVFQRQPEIAHIYLGSRRHVMERIFNDENEPFWRSAKAVELGPIDRGAFAEFVAARFAETGRRVEPDAVGELVARTGGHPYATQELAYFLWELTPAGSQAGPAEAEAALAAVVRAEHAHFSLVWERAARAQRLLLEALAAEQPGHPFSGEYRRRHDLPPASSVQKAARALVERELVAHDGGAYWIREPFLAEWIAANIG